MPDNLEQVRRVVSRDQFAKLCGIGLVRVTTGGAVARMRLEPHHWNGIGTAQGGAIFTLADFAFATASNSHGQLAVGISVSINYLKAVKEGWLVAEAREVSRGARVASYHVEVKEEAGGALVAVFQGMVYRKSQVLGQVAAEA